MTSNRFFVRQRKVQSPRVILDGTEHHHLSRVARIKTGERVWLFDEYGTVYSAKVDKIERDRTSLSLLDRTAREEPRLKLTLAQAMIKRKKMELILQKSTELGIDTFIPVLSALSVIKLEGKESSKVERWKKIAREAAKQCGRSCIPDISYPMSLKEVIQKRKDTRKFFLNEKSGRYIRDVLKSTICNDKDSGGQNPSVLILVGPEGGWTEQEAQDIVEGGFEALSLGGYILRSETAAISSIAMMSHFWSY